MAEVKARVISREEARKTVARLIDHDTANYLIREILMEKGLSASESNEVISEVRSQTVEKVPNVFMDNLGIILLLVLVISLILYVLVNNVQ